MGDTMPVWRVTFGWERGEHVDPWMGGAMVAAPDEEAIWRLIDDDERATARVDPVEGVTATGEPRCLYWDDMR